MTFIQNNWKINGDVSQMNSKEVDNSIKFAWAYLLIHGKLTNGKWNYYGGCWEENGKLKSYQEGYEKIMSDIRDKAVSIGIDWDKTDIPSVTDEDEFTGTFNDSITCLATLGKLVLLNGESFLIGSSDNDAAHLAETARQMKNKLGENEVEELALKL